MKNIIVFLIILFISFSYILINGEIVTCGAKSYSNMMQLHADIKNETFENNEDMDLQDDKDRRFRMLVLAIEQNLIERYNKLDNIGLEGEYLELLESYEKID
jgi:hypothetical protein